jgi:hypothetical protein
MEKPKLFRRKQAQNENNWLEIWPCGAFFLLLHKNLA